ncbi:MAG: class I SAM-dependent methyltransferase [archaeon]
MTHYHKFNREQQHVQKYPCLFSYATEHPDCTFLDCGMGMGNDGLFLQENQVIRIGHYLGIDIDGICISLAKSRLPHAHIYKTNVLQLPFRDASIDIVYANYLLHCLASNRTIKQAVHEMSRVVKENGLVVGETFSASLDETIYAEHALQYVPAHELYRNVLVKTGAVHGTTLSFLAAMFRKEGLHIQVLAEYANAVYDARDATRMIHFELKK